MDTDGIHVERDKINLSSVPIQVKEVIAILERNSFKAYLVGGVVRDIFMGKKPNDYDIATSATPTQVLQFFPGALPTGEKHGTVTVFNGGQGMEVTTLRREGKYRDHRRPDRVEFITDLKEDLSRRDFTINALAMGPDGTLYDYFGGLQDIRDGVIRAVGDPRKRFYEDALRMMRAIRFSCQTGFSIEPNTLECIKENSRLLARVSAERVQQEFNAILLSDLSHLGILLIYVLGLMESIIPELAEWIQLENGMGRGKLFSCIQDVLKLTPAKLTIRLAVLLCDLGKNINSVEAPGENSCNNPVYGSEITGEVLRRLKYDRKTIKSVTSLVNNCGAEWIRERKEIKRVMGRMGTQDFVDLLALLQARSTVSGDSIGEAEVKKLRQMVVEIIANKEPYRLKDLDLNGQDLKKIGIVSGPEMGKVLNKLMDNVLENPEMNQKQRLLELLQSWKSNWEWDFKAESRIQNPESRMKK